MMPSSKLYLPVLTLRDIKNNLPLVEPEKNIFDESIFYVFLIFDYLSLENNSDKYGNQFFNFEMSFSFMN